ncbi:MAG: PAS domain-containing protein [Acidobacteriota bacterium]|nr:PAS domain-containing protein [Acidobacteriota bacterium]
MDSSTTEMQAHGLASLCRSIAEASPTPIAAIEGAGHLIRYVNFAFCRLIGRQEGELIGKPFSSLVQPGDESLSLLDRVYRTGQAETHIGQEDSAFHAFYWSYCMWPVLSADGRAIGTVMQVLEGTLLHQQAVAVNQALMIGSVHQHELTEAANVQLRAEIVERQRTEEVLRHANADLTQFAFAASHDLREPLRMITTYSQLLAKRYRDQLNPEACLFLDYIAESAQRMAGLLADLLSYTQAGVDEERPAEFVDFNTVCDDAVKDLQVAIGESGAVVLMAICRPYTATRRTSFNCSRISSPMLSNIGGNRRRKSLFQPSGGTTNGCLQ